MNDTIEFICECDGLCTKRIQLPLDTALRIKGYVIIVDGCPNEPLSTDIFVKKYEGYTLYE